MGGTGLGLAISRRLARGWGGGCGWRATGRRLHVLVHDRCRVSDGLSAGRPHESESAGGTPDLRAPAAAHPGREETWSTRRWPSSCAAAGLRGGVAADGEETLAALRRQRYDVVLMDVQMPGMDGLEAARRIRAGWPAAERPRIIAVTANALREDREACLSAGMDDYLSKPVLPEDLRAALCRVVGAAVPAPAPGTGVTSAKGDVESFDPTFDPKYIDQLRQLQAMTGQEVVSPIIDRFLAEAPRRLAELRLALTARDDRTFVFVAHTFKASGAQLGACRLAKICHDLEMRGLRVEWPGMEEIVGHLQSEIESVTPLLRAQAAAGRPQSPV